MITIPINAPVPPITIDAGDEQINGAGALSANEGDFAVTGGVTVVGGSEFVLHADSITGNMKSGIATAVGDVSFRELDTYIHMDSLFISETLKAGSAQNVKINAFPYDIDADRLSFQKDQVNLYSAVLTTGSPGQRPEYSIRAKSITYLPLFHKIIVRNGAFYVGASKIFEYPKVTLLTDESRTGQATLSNVFNTSFGYNGYNGAFVIYRTSTGALGRGVAASLTIPEKRGWGALITATVPLITVRATQPQPEPTTLIGGVRQAVEETEPVLPFGDPLLFHWFQTVTAMHDRFLSIPNTLTLDTTATASLREPVYGHETTDLFYSRLPEASFTSVIPLSGPRTLPTSRDPNQMRNALKQIALYAQIIPTVGRYYEYPDNVTSNRASTLFEIESRPILVGNNLLFKPTVSYQDSVYSANHQAFQVFQYDLALEKYFTDQTGLGLEYVQSQEHGSSPFQFDTPYTSEEFDSRFQVGLRRAIIGTVLKYDINGHHFYEEQLMIAPVLRTVVPKFSYDFADSSFNVGIDIQGLTY